MHYIVMVELQSMDAAALQKPECTPLWDEIMLIPRMEHTRTYLLTY